MPSGQSIEPPYALEDHLLPPWSKYWTAAPGTRVSWNPKGFEISGKNSGELMHSAFIPVNAESVMKLRLSVSGSGSVRLAIEDEKGKSLADILLETDQSREYEFNPGNADKVRFVLYAVSASYARKVSFVRFRTPAEPLVRELKLPAPRRWEKSAPRVSLSWQDRSVHLSGTAPAAFYILKSYAVAAPARQQTCEFTLSVSTRLGRPGLGILDSASDTWITNYALGEGKQTYSFEVQGKAYVQFVMYNLIDGPLEFSVDFGELLEHGDDFSLAAVDPDGPKAEKAALQARPPRKKKVYCPYPWSNMANLAADGRVDICCIATGESQPEYALGNLYQDDFQTIWNGAAMRTFRRTIHNGALLPPCLRCPLNRTPSGLMFDAEYTKDVIKLKIKSLRHGAAAIVVGKIWNKLRGYIAPR
jgi:radical SAM protein with 4Fe4S-binding SPASM domain